MGYKVRNATYRPMAEVAYHTASRDLKALVDAGLLIAVGEKKGRHYKASAEILALRRQIRESRQIADPF
jgi:DNA-binding transcriptional ArsR family regulator